MVREGLESRDFEALKLEHRCPSFDAGGDGHQRVHFRVRTIERCRPHVNKNLSQLDLSHRLEKAYFAEPRRDPSDPARKMQS